MTSRKRLAARRELLSCHISQLPSRCKIQIIDYLPARDVKNLRLASRGWIDLCVRGLFNAFDNPSHCIYGSDTVKRGVLSLRPHLKDMERLIHISKRPDMANHIRELEVYVGDFEGSLFRDSTDRVLTERSTEGPEKEDRIADVQRLLDKMHWRLNHCEGFSLRCDFPKFQSLEYLRITSTDYPFCTFDMPLHIEWQRMWDRDDERIKAIRFDLSVARYRWVLITALECLKNPLRKLSLELVPLNVFTRGEEYHDGIGWGLIHMVLPQDFPFFSVQVGSTDWTVTACLSFVPLDNSTKRFFLESIIVCIPDIPSIYGISTQLWKRSRKWRRAKQRSMEFPQPLRFSKPCQSYLQALLVDTSDSKAVIKETHYCISVIRRLDESAVRR